jgi:hypothetical protein
VSVHGGRVVPVLFPFGQTGAALHVDQRRKQQFVTARVAGERGFNDLGLDPYRPTPARAVC